MGTTIASNTEVTVQLKGRATRRDTVVTVSGIAAVVREAKDNGEGHRGSGRVDREDHLLRHRCCRCRKRDLGGHVGNEHRGGGTVDDEV